MLENLYTSCCTYGYWSMSNLQKRIW